LLSDRVRELADHINYSGCSIPKHFVRPACAPTFTARKYKIGADLTYHLHLRLWRLAKDLQHYCAVVQDAPVDMDAGYVIRVSQLRLTETHPPEMDEPVLVLVPEVVNGPHIAAIEPPISLWVGLQRLDECLWAGSGASDLVHAAAPSPVPSFVPLVERGLACVDWERAEGLLAARPIDAQPVHGLVQRGAEVVDRLTQDHGPVDRDRPAEPKPIEVLASVVVNLGYKSPGRAAL
jgi:hypothetical protein